jgi:hypothetical protein
MHINAMLDQAFERLEREPSVVTPKPAIYGHLKTGH